MKIKMNKSITAGIIGLGLSAAAVYAVTPKIKSLASNMSNKMSNNGFYNNSMH